jgi:Spy/CpxP family protein refolding chaperone
MSVYRIVLAAALLSGFTAWAVLHAAESPGAAQAPAMAGGDKHRGHGPMEGFGPFGFMARELNLSDDQRSRVKAIFAAARDEDAPIRQQLEELHQQVHDAIVTNGYNDSQIRALVQAKSSAMVEMAVHGIATLAKVRDVLTPEQQQKLEQLRANRPPHGGPGFGGPGFGPPAL